MAKPPPTPVPTTRNRTRDTQRKITYPMASRLSSVRAACLPVLVDIGGSQRDADQAAGEEHGEDDCKSHSSYCFAAFAALFCLWIITPATTQAAAPATHRAAKKMVSSMSVLLFVQSGLPVLFPVLDPGPYADDESGGGQDP